jgi:hypothetical protein
VNLADQAVIWHGYFRLASWLQKDAPKTWRDDLQALGKPVTYQRDGKTYTGDLFSRDNPVWVDTAVMAPGKRGPRVVNNRQAREAPTRRGRRVGARVPYVGRPRWSGPSFLSRAPR